MLQKQLRKQSEEGFTIIEVLIVLAIAALILLIVFLAVPALQRNSRNNARKNDASRISTAIANWVSNNNGALPGAETGAFVVGTFTTDCGNIKNDVGNLSQFSNFICGAAVGTATVALVGGNPTLVPSSAGAGAYTSGGTFDGLIYDETAVCPTNTSNTSTSLTLTAGNARQSALLYTLETNTGNYNLSCIQVT